MVKGIKLPLFDTDSSLIQITWNYYVKRVDFALFTSPCSGKFSAILEIKRKLKNGIILSKKGECTTSEEVVDINAFDFDGELPSYLIFYNVGMIPFEKIKEKKVHISCFYDYKGLYDSTKFKEYVKEAVPEEKALTVICKFPRKKSVDFLFGTDDSVKHLCIIGENDNSVVYTKNTPTPVVLKYFEKQNIRMVDSITSDFKANKLVFYDIDLAGIQNALYRVDYITVVYTEKDFDTLKKVSSLLRDVGIEVQESILKIIERR
ncbi:hypothetical protein GINT2_000035 [Glugoides intestinalis]